MDSIAARLSLRPRVKEVHPQATACQPLCQLIFLMPSLTAHPSSPGSGAQQLQEQLPLIVGSTVAGFVFMVVVVVIALVCLRYRQAVAAPQTERSPFTAAAILGPGFPRLSQPTLSSSVLVPAPRDFSPYPESRDTTTSHGFPHSNPCLLYSAPAGSSAMALTQSTRRSCSSTVSVLSLCPQCPAPVGLETPFLLPTGCF